MGIALTVRSFWMRFWFLGVDPRRYAALRMAFGSLSVIYFVGLLPYLETQFSGLSWLGDTRQIALQNGGSWSLFFLDLSDNPLVFAYAVIAVGIGSATFMAIGWHSRLTAGITWLVWVSFWNRNPLLLDGDDAVLKVMCFYLMLSPCGCTWSLDSWRGDKTLQVDVWPLRLIQFQVALIYFVSGWVKFHSPEWLEGTVIQYVLVNPQYSRWDGWQIIGKPFMDELLSGLAVFIMWWEVLFPLLMLNNHSRKLCLVLGLLFHLGLLCTMNLRWFAVIMPSLYLALIPESWFKRFEKRLKNCLQPTKLA